MFVSKLQQSAMVAGKPCWMICLKHGCPDKTLFLKEVGQIWPHPIVFLRLLPWMVYIVEREDNSTD